MRTGSAKAGGKPQPFTDAEAARVVVEVERTRKPPDKAALDRLGGEWGDGALLAQQDGRAGVEQWLRTLLGRDPARHSAILGALEVAREAAKDDRDDEEPIAGQVGEPWQDPTLGTTPPAVPFPVDVFPPQLADLVVDLADVLNSPTDFVAVSALFTASTVTGRSVALRLRETWEEVPSSYYALVGVSGLSKTNPIMKMTRPLWDISREEMEEWKRLKESQEGKKEDEKEEIPPLKRIVVDQSTVEGIPPMLQDNPKGIGQIRDELTGLFAGMNQYKGGKGSDRQFYLSADSGSPVSIDRRVNPDGLPIVVPHPCLSLIGGVVNSKLASLSDANDRDDGFIERILFTVPEPIRVRWSRREVDPGLIQDWNLAVRRLWERAMVGDDVPRPYFVRFEPAAQSIFIEWFDSHSEEAESLDFPAYLGGTWSKMRGKCGRLALLLHMLAWAYDPTEGDRLSDVSVSSVRAAIRLIDYFKAHARRAHALMRGHGGEDNEDARAILRWVFNTERRTFDERGAKLNFPNRFPTNGQELGQAITWLIARKCIRRLPTPPPNPKGGRRPGASYEVNPALLHPTLLNPGGEPG